MPQTPSIHFNLLSLTRMSNRTVRKKKKKERNYLGGKIKFIGRNTPFENKKKLWVNQHMIQHNLEDAWEGLCCKPKRVPSTECILWIHRQQWQHFHRLNKCNFFSLKKIKTIKHCAHNIKRIFLLYLRTNLNMWFIF